MLASFVPLLTWNISCVELLGRTLTVLKSSPTTEQNAGNVIGLFSTYVPDKTFIVVSDVAIPTAALIVKNALSIDVPLFVSNPSLATYKTFGAELIPEALALIVTPEPIVIAEFVIVTSSSPMLIVLVVPSIVTDPLPTVKIPKTLESPSTKRAVFPTPTMTVPTPVLDPRVVIPSILALPLISKSFNPVIIPTDSISTTSLL